MAFVLLWSTGFISAKYALPYAEPFTILSYRSILVLCLLLPFILIFVRKPASLSQWFHSMVSGALIHGAYLGGVFFAISKGMPAGVSALVVAIQPLLTVIIAWLLMGERVTRAQLMWFAAALFGVFLIVWPKLELIEDTSGITPLTLAASLLAAIGISAGAVYQKRFVSDLDLRHSTAAQFMGAAILTTLLSFLFETREIVWSTQFTLALGWMVLPLSIGSVALLMILIRRGSSSSVASLFYLVPAVASILAWLLFGEVLTPIQIFGGVVIALAVAFSTRK